MTPEERDGEPIRRDPSGHEGGGHRREDAPLVTGRGTYVPNHAPEGMLHAGFVRSYLAHGRVSRVAVDAALDQPGVVAAFDSTTLGLGLMPIPGHAVTGFPQIEGMERDPLARDRVRYVGEPLAVVLGSSAAAVADAVEHVEVELEPLPVASTLDLALTEDTLLFPDAGTNVAARLRASAPEGAPGLDAWPVQVELMVDNPRLAVVPLEPLSLLVRPSRDGLEVLVGHQAPTRLRNQLSQQLGLPLESIRVVVPDNGGGFGLRGMLVPEHLIVCAAALKLRRPVRWVETRTESFQGGPHGRAMRHRMRLAGTTDGVVKAARVQIAADIGAYPHGGAHVPPFAHAMTPGPYAIQDLEVETTLVVTNRAPTGSYRGAGRPEATFAIERAMEAFGQAVGLDAVEIRRRNLVGPDALPYRSATGALYDSGNYGAALERALEIADVAVVRAEQRRRRASGQAQLGLGVASFIERAGGHADSTEFASLEVDDAGAVTVRIGSVASGQGHHTVWADLVSEVLGVEPDTVVVISGDTDAVPTGEGTYGSRSAQVGGSAIWRCGQRLRERILVEASVQLEVDAADLELAAGAVRVRGAPARRTSLGQIATALGQRGDELVEEEDYSPHAQTFPYGATVAVVEVDVETGRVQLERLVAVDDCGIVLNDAIVEGQVHGSLAQGIAQALHEEVVYGPDGQLLTASLMDYHVPAAPDLPDLETDRLLHPAPSNPLGAKGVGETGCLGAPPAIVNAVIDALRPYGVSDLRMPLTPQRVWEAIQGAGRHAEDGERGGSRSR